MTILFIQICWVVFVLYWLVSAFFVKPATERTGFGARQAYRIPIMAGVFIFIWRRSWAPLREAIIPHNDATAFLACAVCALGLFVCLWARWTLGGNWSGDVTFKQGHELIERGPYRFARHPIYSGLLLMFLGTALRRGDIGGFVALGLIFIGFWIKLRKEEDLMLRHFPDQYPSYRARVKAIVPFVF